MSHLDAAIGMNRFILANAEFRTLTGYNGTGLQPIFPVQDEPESNVPYLTYMTRTSIDIREWWISDTEVIYIVHDTFVGRAGQIASLLINLFRRGDESAAELNAFLGPTFPHVFHSTAVSNAAMIEPAMSEAGRRERVVSFRVRHSEKEGIGLAF